MAGLHDFTTKEVLNKVLLDSSGDAVAAFSHTSQEALNAVLDSANSRLNVSLVGGTISGDVTISGDLTVEGDSVSNISETVQGDMKITSSADGHPILTLEQTGDNSLSAQLIFLTSGAANDNDDSGVIRFKGMNDAGTPEEIEYATIFVNHDDVSDGSEDATMHFRTQSGGSLASRMVIKSGNVGIGVDDPGEGKLVVVDSVKSEVVIKTTDAATGTEAALMFKTSTGNIDQRKKTGIIHKDVGGNGTGDLFFVLDTSEDDGSATVADNTAMVIKNSGKVGINELIPVLHLHVTNDAATSPSYATDQCAIFEDDNRPGIQIVGSASNIGIIQFGDNAGANQGQINYNHSSDTLQLGASAAIQLILDANSRISLSNNLLGSNNTVFGKGSGLDLQAGASFNDFFGEDSGANITTGDENVFVGYRSGFYNVTGGKNTAVGSTSMRGASGNSHSNNTAVGYASLNAITTGDANTVIGVDSAKALTVESNNVSIGAGAMSAVQKGAAGNQYTNSNIAIGHNALTGGQPSSGSFEFNIAIGSDALNSTGTSVGTSGTIAIGASALTDLTTGARNTMIGNESGTNITTSADNTAIGYNAMHGNDSTATTGTGRNTAIGSSSLLSITTGQQNVAIGTSSGATITGSSNTVLIGHNAGTAINNSTANGTIAIGSVAGSSMTTGLNTIVGNQAFQNGITGTFNVAIGNLALSTADGAESNNVAIGESAGSLINNDASADNVLVGHLAGKGGTGEIDRCVAIGHQAMDGTGSLGGTQNIFIGNDAGGGTWSGSASNSNVAIGATSMSGALSGALDNTALGHDTLKALTTGDNNVALGSGAAAALTTANSTIFIGKNAGATATVTNSGDSDGTIGIGLNTLNALTSGAGNTAIGYQAMKEDTNSNKNVVIGYEAAFNTNDQAQTENVFIGYHSGGGAWAGVGRFNVGIGKDSLSGNISGADNNVSIGHSSGSMIIGGDENCLIGTNAGNSITLGSGNICIGSETDISAVDGTNQIAIGKAVTGIADNTAVIGNTSVTDVYMASDATTGTTQTEGANVIARSGYFKRVALDGSLTGGSSTSDNPILTLHGAYNQDVTGSNGHSLKFVMQDEATNNAETARIATVSRSGGMASNLGSFGTDLEFHNRVNGTLTKQMTLVGGDGRNKMIIHGNNAGSGGGAALEVFNDGGLANREGIHIHAGKDTLGSNADAVWLRLLSGDGDDIASIQYVHSGVTAGIVATSDERLKENIKDTSIKGVETIDSLKLREFNWKSEVNRGSDKIKVGLIAQEVEKIDDIKDMVVQGGKFGEKRNSNDVITQEAILNDVKSLEWTSSIPYLIKAVQELSARVKELESK